MIDNIIYHNTTRGEIKVSKKISQHKVFFTPTCASDKIINDMEIDFSPLITDNNNNLHQNKKDESQYFSFKTLSPYREKKKKSLAPFDENFNEIITSLEILGKEKEKQKIENEEKSNKEKKKKYNKNIFTRK